MKTVIQIVSVVAAILAHHWNVWHFGPIVIPVVWIAVAAIYYTVLVSVVSAVDYFIGFWKHIDSASNERRKSFVLSRNAKHGATGTH